MFALMRDLDFGTMFIVPDHEIEWELENATVVFQGTREECLNIMRGDV